MNEHDQKHLTLSNRTYIEQELLQKSTFSSTGTVLHKDPSTISKEVKRYSKTVPAKYSYKCNLCKHYKDCDLRSKELKCPRYSIHCSFYCKKCCRRTVIDCMTVTSTMNCNFLYSRQLYSTLHFVLKEALCPSSQKTCSRSHMIQCRNIFLKFLLQFLMYRNHTNRAFRLWCRNQILSLKPRQRFVNSYGALLKINIFHL